MIEDLIRNARELRHMFLSDPYRPRYHFVVPEGVAMPFDPNGCIHWKGKYHMFYIYQDPKYPYGGHCWGHVSSLDAVHWVHHLPGLTPTNDSPEVGIFSGNCFVNKRGEATILYHGVNAGNCIATSSDDELNVWHKLPNNPIIPNPEPGAPYASWDPHGWLEGDTYYAIFGGTRPAVFKAKELDRWEYVGDLFAHALPDVDINEDVSCPDLFKLGDRYVLLCISHRLGCRYYIGEWKNEQFYPEFHEKMSWVDNAFFAPESMQDHKGRRIMWAWIFDGLNQETLKKRGWSGTMSLPRILWLDQHKRLRMRPLDELKSLRYNPVVVNEFTIRSNSEHQIKEIKGDSIELIVKISSSNALQFGIKVFCSPDCQEQTLIFYDSEEKALKIDTTNSSVEDSPKTIERAPFELDLSKEQLELRVFLDRSVIEVFANDRQAVMRRVYPSRNDSKHVMLFSVGGNTKVSSIEGWTMAPSNPF